MNFKLLAKKGDRGQGTGKAVSAPCTLLPAPFFFNKGEEKL
jgi:hypothetical protein